jgi:hypothetical protein
MAGVNVRSRYSTRIGSGATFKSIRAPFQLRIKVELPIRAERLLERYELRNLILEVLNVKRWARTHK